MKFSIPAFIEQITPDDTKTTQYSRAKLKIFYVGETGDHRLFTQTFADKLLAGLQFTPVVGYYDTEDADFIGHNAQQNIYGICPSSEFEYVEEDGVKFAVTDVLLYTERPDQTGYIAKQIIGKQHSLELLPDSVQYTINRDEEGNFKNFEFTDGVLIGLSVLGDSQKPAFAGSEFFTEEALPDFVTDENRANFIAAFEHAKVTPTIEDMMETLYSALEREGLSGYPVEYIPNEYVTLEVYRPTFGFKQYRVTNDENGISGFEFVADVRRRFISNDEITLIEQLRKGKSVNEPQKEEEIDPISAPASDAALDDQTESTQCDGEPAPDAGLSTDGSDDGRSDTQCEEGTGDGTGDETPATTEPSPVVEEPAEPIQDEPATEPVQDEPVPEEPVQEEPVAEPVQDTPVQDAPATTAEAAFEERFRAFAEQFEQRFDAVTQQCKTALLNSYRPLLDADAYTEIASKADSFSVTELTTQLAQAYESAVTDQVPYAVAFTGTPSAKPYDETDPEQVMAKYHR